MAVLSPSRPELIARGLLFGGAVSLLLHGALLFAPSCGARTASAGVVHLAVTSPSPGIELEVVSLPVPSRGALTTNPVVSEGNAVRRRAAPTKRPQRGELGELRMLGVLSGPSDQLRAVFELDAPDSAVGVTTGTGGLGVSAAPTGDPSGSEQETDEPQTHSMANIGEQPGPSSPPEGVPAAPAGGGDGANVSEELHRRLVAAARSCYPTAAKRLRLEGQARLTFCLDERSSIRSRRIDASTGTAVLDRAALECVLDRASPLQAPPGCYTVPVRFGESIGR